MRVTNVQFPEAACQAAFRGLDLDRMNALVSRALREGPGTVCRRQETRDAGFDDPGAGQP